MAEKKKVRIELQLDTEKDADLIQFIDDNGSTRAGFIKHTLRHYMNTVQSNKPMAAPKPKPKKETKPSTSKPKKTSKKKAPKLGQSFSSNDFKN